MNLTPQQQRVAELAEQPHSTFVTACPGAGKTATIIEYLRNLLAHPFHKSDPIVAITFTTAAAAEIRRRLGTVESGRDLFIGTIHGFALRTVKQTEDGMQAKSRVASPAVSESFARLVRDTVSGRRHGIRDILDLVSGAAPERTMKDRAVVAAYTRHLKAARLIDCATMLRSASKMAFAPAHVIVDEAQDTGPAEWSVLGPLIDKAKSVLVVGDVNQSIYGFNGADPRELVARTEGWDRLRLSSNFRCAENICDAADDIIGATGHERMTSLAATQPGDFKVVLLDGDGSDSTLSYIGSQLANLEGSTAILCRTNEERLRVAQHLGLELETYAEDISGRELAEMIVELAGNPDATDTAVTVLAMMGLNPNAWNIHGGPSTIAGPADTSVTERIRTVLSRTAPADAQARIRQARIIVNSAIVTAAEMAGIDQHELTAGEILVAIADAAKTGTGSRRDDGPTVATIHAAKGREWDNVILPWWNAVAFPARRDIEEERRLAYVAVSRARSRCVIIAQRGSENQWARDLSEG